MFNCMFNTQSLVPFRYLMFDPLYILCPFSLPKACPATFLRGGGWWGESQVKASVGIWFCHSWPWGLGQVT